MNAPGEVAEWSIAPDLKSGEGKLSGSSNLPLSVIGSAISIILTEIILIQDYRLIHPASL